MGELLSEAKPGDTNRLANEAPESKNPSSVAFYL